MAVAESLDVIIQAKVDDAIRKMKQVDGQLGNVEKSGGKLEKLFKRGLAAAAAAVSIGALTKAVRSSVEAFRAQEEAEAQLRGALLATGENAEIVGAQIAALAAELQQVTTFGDEATIQAAGLLQSLADLNSDGLQKVIPAMQDFATGMGIDLKNAAQLIGKTLSSSTNALVRYGIEIDASASKEVKLAQLTEELNKKFGGLSQEMADTASGSLTQMNNALGDLAEVAGGNVLDFFSGAIRGTTQFAQKLTEAAQEASDLRKILGSDEIAEEVDLQSRLAYWEERRAKLLAKLSDETAGFRAEAAGYASQSHEAARQNLEDAEERITKINREIALNQQRANLEADLARAIAENDERAQAAAEAALEAQARQEQHLQNIAEAYALTEQGQREALESQIAYFSSFEIQGQRTVAIIERLEERLAQLNDTGKETFEAQNAEVVKWVLALKNAESAIISLEGTTGDSVEEMEDKWEQAFTAMYSSARTTFDAFLDLEDTRHDRIINNLQDELERMQERHEQEIAFAEDMGATEQEIQEMKREQAEEEATAKEQLERKKAKLDKEQFQRRKAVAISDATIQGALAVVKALAELGPIAGPIAAGTIGTMTAAQIALIGAQKYPGFAQGGDFMTNGPQAIVVGDNPGGRERVRIDPQPDNRSTSEGMHVHFHNPIIGSKEDAAEYIREGERLLEKRGVA